MSQSDFTLAPQLAADCVIVTELKLCLVLMMNDTQYPWFILVPKIPQVTEVLDLNEERQQQLWRESNLLNKAIKALFSPDKLNLAALGNMVPQLHLHHIARFRSDIAWPKPVWGVSAAVPMTAEQISQRTTDMKNKLEELLC